MERKHENSKLTFVSPAQINDWEMYLNNAPFKNIRKNTALLIFSCLKKAMQFL